MCVDEMKYLWIIPDFLSVYGVFTSQVRQASMVTTSAKFQENRY